MFRFRILKVSFTIICIAHIYLFTSCNSNNSDYVTGSYPLVRVYNQEEVDSIITSHDTTIIFLWTGWCHASHNTFKEHITSFLNQKVENIGFISIFYGKENVLDSMLKENQCSYPSYCLTSYGGIIDKRNMYYLLNLSLKDYKHMNYVPVSVMCDKKGNILNYEDKTKEYSHISTCIRIVDRAYWNNPYH